MDKEIYDAVYSVSGQKKRRGYSMTEATLPDDSDVRGMIARLLEFLEAFPGQTKVRDLRAGLEELKEELGDGKTTEDKDAPRDLVRR